MLMTSLIKVVPLKTFGNGVWFTDSTEVPRILNRTGSRTRANLVEKVHERVPSGTPRKGSARYQQGFCCLDKLQNSLWVLLAPLFLRVQRSQSCVLQLVFSGVCYLKSSHHNCWLKAFLCLKREKLGPCLSNISRSDCSLGPSFSLPTS